MRRSVLIRKPSGSQPRSIDIDPDLVLFAKLKGPLADVNGSTKGISIGESKPERDESLFNIFLEDFLKLVNVHLVVEQILVVDIGNRPSMVNILDHESLFAANVTARTEVAHKL